MMLLLPHLSFENKIKTTALFLSNSGHGMRIRAGLGPSSKAQLPTFTLNKGLALILLEMAGIHEVDQLKLVRTLYAFVLFMCTVWELQTKLFPNLNRKRSVLEREIAKLGA